MGTDFLILSKNKSLLLKRYIFGSTNDFLQIVKECFDVLSLDDDSVKIKAGNWEFEIYYSSEFDKSRNQIEGHVLIEVIAEESYSTIELQDVFGDFVRKTKTYLYLISGDEERLILESKNVEDLN